MPLHWNLDRLEDRRLLASDPWGAWPQLIDLDVAATAFPSITGSGQTIAILDTGALYNHATLGGGYGSGYKVIGGYDFVDNDSNPIDQDGHGSAVASLVAGDTYSYGGASYRGVAPDANLVILRIDDGSGDIPDSRYEAALQWVIDYAQTYNIVSVNISEGGTESFSYITTNNSPYADELAALKDMNVFIAVAAGNDGVTDPPGIEYPAADPSVFSVGSIDLNDDVAAHSSRAAILDILAPGQNVPALYMDTNGDPLFYPVTGTSFATPFVAGMAALIRQISPDFTPDDVMDILRTSGQSVYDPQTGLTFKRIDVDGALAEAYSRIAPPTPTLGENGTDNDLVYSASGTLHFAYYDSVEGNLKYAWRPSGGQWSDVQIIDDSADVGRYCSIAVDASGNPGMAYYDQTHQDLKYAKWDGSQWTIQVVDSTGKTGIRPSLAFDPKGLPGISYRDGTNQDLKFATLSGAYWSRRIIDSSGDVGRYSSLGWRRTSGRWAVAYERLTAGLFRYAQRNSNGTWNITTVDDTAAGGGYVSLAFDKSGRPAFSYYDSYQHDLKFAHHNGSKWQISRVASSGTQGLYSNLVFDSDGDANIVYENATASAIYLAWGDVGKWTYWRMINGAGTAITAVLGPADRLTLVYRTANSNALHLMDFD